jgi:hypothetical protein
MAEEEGVLGGGVAVQAHIEHVGARLEKGLAAVAVVVVDVEQRDARAAAVEQRLRGQRGVVEEAVAAHEIGAGVMARRPAGAEHGALAARQQHALPRCRRRRRRPWRPPRCRC